MSEPGLAVVLASVIALIHFLGEEVEEYISGYREQIVSFGSGVSITYIFMQLIPEFQRLTAGSSQLIFAFPLLGFSSIHLVEKYLAKSGLNDRNLRRDYGEIHAGFLFLYHGAIGYLIASLLAESAVTGILFALPIMLHVAVSSFSMTELNETVMQEWKSKALISVAPLIGVLLHNIGAVTENGFKLLFGSVLGMFFYVVIRDSIPKEDKGMPKEYVAGMLVYLAVIFASRLV